MKYLRLPIVPLFAIALLFLANGMYPVTVANAAQKGHAAHSKKPPAQFHYVCPMHEDVTAKKRGTCPKCKMKLVRKALPPKTSQ